MNHRNRDAWQARTTGKVTKTPNLKLTAGQENPKRLYHTTQSLQIQRVVAYFKLPVFNQPVIAKYSRQRRKPGDFKLRWRCYYYSYPCQWSYRSCLGSLCLSSCGPMSPLFGTYSISCLIHIFFETRNWGSAVSAHSRFPPWQSSTWPNGPYSNTLPPSHTHDVMAITIALSTHKNVLPHPNTKSNLT